jgi:hypothetical protein
MHLSYAERSVALALYRQGGGTLDTDAFVVALERDPLAQRVAREATPVVEQAVRRLADLLSVTAPSLSFAERQIVRRFEDAPNGICDLCEGGGRMQARLPHVLTWTRIPCPECMPEVER